LAACLDAAGINLDEVWALTRRKPGIAAIRKPIRRAFKVRRLQADNFSDDFDNLDLELSS